MTGVKTGIRQSWIPHQLPDLLLVVSGTHHSNLLNLSVLTCKMGQF